MTPHKHAEIIKAWADGQRIQVWDEDDECWYDCSSTIAWHFAPSDRYRIKPDPLPDVVKYAICNHDFMVTYNDERGLSDNLLLTWDGETGKLKSAEVLL